MMNRKQGDNPLPRYKNKNPKDNAPMTHVFVCICMILYVCVCVFCVVILFCSYVKVHNDEGLKAESSMDTWVTDYI